MHLQTGFYKQASFLLVGFYGTAFDRINTLAAVGIGTAQTLVGPLSANWA